MARFDSNPAFVEEYAREVGPRWQAEVGSRTSSAISSAAPRETGFMKTSSRQRDYTDHDGNPAFDIIYRAPYTTFVDQGTGIYGPKRKPITSKTGKVLSWIDAQSGGRVFARSTIGQPGKRFFRIGLSAIFGAENVDEHRFGRR